jgi:hypothetical protein
MSTLLSSLFIETLKHIFLKKDASILIPAGAKGRQGGAIRYQARAAAAQAQRKTPPRGFTKNARHGTK